MIDETPQWIGPRLVTEVEITNRHSIPVLHHTNNSKLITYERAYVLVKLSGHPIGIVEIPFHHADLEPSVQFETIVQSLESEIREDLREHHGLIDVPDVEAALNTVATKAVESRRSAAGQPMPLVSVVIGTRNRTDKLRITLNQLLKVDYPNYEIIVVDNAPSDDRTQTLIETEFKDNRIHYVCEPMAGLGRARNRGITEARGELIAVTDDDVLVCENWLSALVDGFRGSDPGCKVACVTGLILPAELETPAQELLERYGGFSRGYKRQTYDLKTHRLKSFLYPYSAGIFGSGANMAFTREFLCQIKGFDPALGAGTIAMGGEDLAIFFQVITSGGQLVYEPDALLYHFHNAKYEDLRKQMYAYGVGLVAYILKIVLDQPWRIFEVGVRLPAAVVRVLSQTSTKNVKKGDGYPAELSRVERIGMLHGPFLFIRSLIKTYRVYGSRYSDLC